jgi:hypothetical protein
VEIKHKNNLGLVFKATFLVRLINFKNKSSLMFGYYHLKKCIEEDVENYMEPKDWKNEVKRKKRMEELFETAQLMLVDKR